MAAIEDLFVRWEMQDLRHPEFTKVFKGLDPDEVDAYVGQIVERVRVLQDTVERLKTELTAARHSAASFKEEAYHEVAGRLAGIMHAADETADDLVRSAQEESERRLSDAEARAGQILSEGEASADRARLEAEAHARSLRKQAEQALSAARGEADRVLGSLESKQQAMFQELGAVRERLGVLVGIIDGVLPGPRNLTSMHRPAGELGRSEVIDLNEPDTDDVIDLNESDTDDLIDLNEPDTDIDEVEEPDLLLPPAEEFDLFEDESAGNGPATRNGSRPAEE